MRDSIVVYDTEFSSILATHERSMNADETTIQRTPYKHKGSSYLLQHAVKPFSNRDSSHQLSSGETS